jgi:hypothetical protein
MMIKRRRTGIVKNKRKGMVTDARTGKLITLKGKHGFKDTGQVI